MPDKQKRERDWCITDWDASKEHRKEVIEALKADKSVYCAIVTVEKGKTKTYGGRKLKNKKLHLQIFIRMRHAKTMSACKKAYFGGKSHLEKRFGTPYEAWTYCEMECKPIYTKGECPSDAESANASIWDRIEQRIDEGASEWEIMKEFPAAYARYSTGIGKMMYLHDETKLLNRFRQVSVTYLWGETGSGKTRSVLEKDPGGVYRCNANLKNPFDGYKGQKTLVLDEFRSSITMTEMLDYIDGYFCQLPCRYYNKVAKWEKVYIISNEPLEDQYVNIQENHPETWDAFLRRIHTVVRLDCPKKDGDQSIDDWL
jgi:hypothetical protein